jgi:hypothetical protein
MAPTSVRGYGAADVIWLATLPSGTSAPNGELVQFRKVLPFRPDTCGH